MENVLYCFQCYGPLPHAFSCRYCPECGARLDGGGFTKEDVEKAKKVTADMAELLSKMRRDPSGPPRHIFPTPWHSGFDLVLS